MKRWHWDVLLFALASPILLIRACARLLRHIAFLRMSIQPTLRCRTCSAQIPMLGMWKCGCGSTFQGHVLSECEVCHSVPSMIRCYRCGATQAVHR